MNELNEVLAAYFFYQAIVLLLSIVASHTCTEKLYCTNERREKYKTIAKGLERRDI